MNPYALIAAGIFWLASLIGVGIWQHGAGDDARAKIDQAKFDKINQDSADNKALANGIYRSAQANIITLQAERDQFKNQLEKDHATHQAVTDALRRKYADLSLRFAAETPGHGAGGAGPMSAAANAPSLVATAVVQLPGPLAARLRQHAADADKLADDYRKCYDYANGMK